MEPNDGEAGAPAPKRPSRVWLMIMGAAAFGGVKFCAKRAPKLADNAAREVRHADEVLDGVDGARRGQKLAEEGGIAGQIGEIGADIATDQAVSATKDLSSDDEDYEDDQ
ncbi:MAG: hypothetical protein AAFP86_21415 [Planctomycetota bacterium]